MTASDYLELLARGAGISLVTYAVIGQVVKPLVRMLAKRSAKGGKLSRAQEEFYRWLTRALCIAMGAALGCLPLWPEYLPAEWGVLIGCGAGSMAPAIHHAVAKALPARIKKLISGGSVVQK